jgi:hypothetical protein
VNLGGRQLPCPSPGVVAWPVCRASMPGPVRIWRTMSLQLCPSDPRGHGRCPSCMGSRCGQSMAVPLPSTTGPLTDGRSRALGDQSYRRSYRRSRPAACRRLPRPPARPRGGITLLARITSLDRDTVARGRRELDQTDAPRRAGCGVLEKLHEVIRCSRHGENTCLMCGQREVPDDAQPLVIIDGQEEML